MVVHNYMDGENMTNDEHDDGLPEAVVRNTERLQQEQSEKSINLLDKLVGHVQNSYISWEKVQLPSKGYYYDDKMPDGWLEVKPMGVDVDKMLTNQRLVANGELLNRVIEVCTKLPDDFNIREMLAGDFNFLLYHLRGITHGPEYEFVANCPSCKTKNTFTFDLNVLSDTITWANNDYLEEPFEVRLPVLSETFGEDVCALVRMIRVDDIMKMARPGEDKVFDPVKRGNVSVRNKNKTVIRNQQQNLEKIYEDNMRSQIVALTINGQRYDDKFKINSIINKMHQRDAAAISTFLEKVSPGIDTTLDVVCVNEDCKHEFGISLPFNENFFRPNS